MKKIIAVLTVLALASCNKKEETNIQTEENNPVEITETQESQSPTLLKEMSQEQISEVLTPKKNDTIYVTNFFATWCRPCMEEMPHFQEKMAEMKNEKVKFTFINLDEPQNWTKVTDFAEKSGLKNNIILFNFGNLSQDFFSKNFETWRGDAIPFTLITKGEKREEIMGAFPSKEALTEKINSLK